MNEFYWINRLDHVNDFLGGLCIICWIVLIICLFVFLMSYNAEAWSYESRRLKCRKYSKGFFFICAILIFCVNVSKVFIPSTTEAYTVIGIKGIFEYLKQNDACKKLPDKVIKAIDIYLDSQIKDADTIVVNDTIPNKLE